MCIRCISRDSSLRTVVMHGHCAVTLFLDHFCLPHTDKGGLLNVRLVVSLAAVAASEESEDNVSFNPQTMHAGAGADLAACCATVIGRLQNGTVTLQVGGVGFHTVGPLSPGSL